MTREEMKARIKAYANRIVKLCEALPDRWVARTLGMQLLRSGTSGHLLLCAEHGSLYCRAFDAQTLLLVLTDDQQTEQQLDTLLESYDHN